MHLNPVCMLHYCEVIVLSTSFLCSSWRSGCHACMLLKLPLHAPAAQQIYMCA